MYVTELNETISGNLRNPVLLLKGHETKGNWQGFYFSLSVPKRNQRHSLQSSNSPDIKLRTS